MTIPKLTPYTGEVANPDGSQTQTEFTTNMFNQLSYEADLATELEATVDGINNAVDEVSQNASIAESSSIAAEAAASSAGYKGLWPDVGGSALKGETYQTQAGGVPTGNYFTALQNTSVDPVGDNVNWKAINDYGSVQSNGLVVKHRRGTNAEIMANIPAIGELWFNTTDKSIHMGDGVTPGGIKHVNVNTLPDYTSILFESKTDAANSPLVKPGVVAEIGDAKFLVTTGASPFPLIDFQSTSNTFVYFKLLPMEGTNYTYSFLAAGGKNDLTISDENSDVMNQLIDKIYTESPLIGGVAFMAGGQYWFSKPVNPENITGVSIKGEYSPITYNNYRSKTIIYTDNSFNSGLGGFVIDFNNCQYMGISDVALRGELSSTPNHDGIFIGTRDSFGFGNALVERVNVHGYGDGMLMKNGGINTVRDYQASRCSLRGLALETSGDTCLYNIYCNTNNKDTTDTSVLSGTGLYIGQGSNNTTALGGKLEFNSKGLVIAGSNGVTALIQYDYNSMCNVIVRANNDTNEACRGISLGGSRILSGGVVEGYEKASIYTDSTLGSVSVNMMGGTLRVAGDGAYDNSDSGILGPQIGIVANGNSTYTNEVHFEGDGTKLGIANAAKAVGSKTSITLGGLLPKGIGYEEISGGTVVTKQNFKELFTPVLSGSFGVPTYATQLGEIHVSAGIATVNILIQLSDVGTLTGDLVIGGLTVASKSEIPPSMSSGVTSSFTNVVEVSGYIDKGSSNITLFKTNTSGESSRLNASDLQNTSLLRCSVSFSV